MNQQWAAGFGITHTDPMSYGVSDGHVNQLMYSIVFRLLLLLLLILILLILFEIGLIAYNIIAQTNFEFIIQPLVLLFSAS